MLGASHKEWRLIKEPYTPGRHTLYRPMCPNHIAVTRARPNGVSRTPESCQIAAAQPDSARCYTRTWVYCFFAASLTRFKKCRTTAEGSPRRDARFRMAFGWLGPLRRQ